jgi:hypothetical protein
MDFGKALLLLKGGRKVARAGWNGKGMWVVLSDPANDESKWPDEPPERMTADEFAKMQTPSSGFFSYINGPKPFPTRPFLAMKTANDEMVPWVAAQTDLLANDWEEVQ